MPDYTLEDFLRDEHPDHFQPKPEDKNEEKLTQVKNVKKDEESIEVEMSKVKKFE